MRSDPHPTAGLDPRRHESGTSVRRPSRISKVGNCHLRRSLYMPALVAFQRDEHVAGFYQHLVAAGKPRKVAVVAVMRKLLHAVWGIVRSDQPWDSARFYRLADDAESEDDKGLESQSRQKVVADTDKCVKAGIEADVNGATTVDELTAPASVEKRARPGSNWHMSVVRQSREELFLRLAF
ncbi:MAG: IS110 family transposase [Myxococcales bacterium]|nr:IS110 family transposase [Myxococcales bacterium]